MQIAQVDKGVVETLDAEAARLKAQLQETNTSKLALEPETKRLNDDEQNFELQRFEFQDQISKDVETAGNAAAESRGQLAVINSALHDLQEKAAAIRELVRSSRIKKEDPNNSLKTINTNQRNEGVLGIIRER
ncbi:MAG: hypothetical protein CM15mP49_27830 [Actinomycetota bacterium]|nr:MAG: hypothetical protein CM15mP49_27830 [Actinomycetota bacterium]